MAAVHNRSNRPIRNVICRASNSGLPLAYPGVIGPLLGDNGAPVLAYGIKNSRIPLARVGTMYGFLFSVNRQANPDFAFVLRFTDDADLEWQIDNDLHLQKLDHRDW
jgi:hypothetical protein